LALLVRSREGWALLHVTVKQHQVAEALRMKRRLIPLFSFWLAG